MEVHALAQMFLVGVILGPFDDHFNQWRARLNAVLHQVGLVISRETADKF